jgi:tRNA nucleotidyltransferase (CCA-adding enzyme)
MTIFQELPNQQRRTMDLVREVALEKECRPYLVGGPVRDMLLGRHSIDIDLTLESDASTLARALAKRTEGRVRSFPQFLTYKVVATGYPEIDLATARKERYRQPGALPAVTAGRLKDDLLRRDFSINAIAVDVLTGALHDPVHGEQDLAARVVRVLHDRSFVDDPTRIFRATRLAARLGFSLEERTEQLMREAIESGALSTVSKERIWRELFLAMDEEDAPRIVEELWTRGALEVLFGRRSAAGLRERLASMQERVASDSELDGYVMYTGAMLRGDASPVDFEGSGFSQKRARNIVEIANELPRVRESLAAAVDDHERFAIYRRLSSETLAAIQAEAPEETAHIARYRDFEKFRLPLRGNDLDVPGGPHVAQALEKTREAVFSGEIPADEARAYARQEAKRLLDSGDSQHQGDSAAQ